MTKHSQSIKAFGALGQLFNDYKSTKSKNDNWAKKLDNAVVKASNLNKWFTIKNINFCINAWSKTLKINPISKWLHAYSTTPINQRLGLVLAGNIPMVGLHDILCGMATGYQIEVKLSSNDKILLPFVVDFMTKIEPSFRNSISFTESKLKEYDKVIATGNNNTARYFEYYFKNKPHIIRKTRNGIAVLDGSENKNDLAALCQDIMLYFGLGCRSVSHLIVPEGYDFKNLFLAIYNHKEVINHNAYANNYDYNKAVFLMQEQKLLENGFIMFKKDERLNSPIACVHFSTYKDLKEVKQSLIKNEEQIQCVVSNCLKNTLSFGQTQSPGLRDYADHIDTMEFLLKN